MQSSRPTDNLLNLHESYNVLIRALNAYISKNVSKLKDKKDIRSKDVADIIKTIRNNSDRNAIKEFDSANPEILPEFKLEQLTHFTVYQLMAKIKSMLDILAARMRVMETGLRGNSTLRDAMLIAIKESASITNAAANTLQNKHEEYKQLVAVKNQNDDTYLMKFPRDLFGHLLLFLPTREISKLRRAAKIYRNSVDNHEIWKSQIAMEFRVNPDEAIKLKKDSSWYMLMHQMRRINHRCVKIRETERLNMIKRDEIGAAVLYKQSSATHLEDLREGMKAGESALESKFNNVANPSFSGQQQFVDEAPEFGLYSYFIR